MGKRAPRSSDELDDDLEGDEGEEEAASSPENTPPVDEKALITAERQLLEAKITEEFDEAFVKVLRRVAYYLSNVGLTLREACQLVQMPLEDMEAKMALYPVIAELIAFKELEYKADLLATISQKARTGNDKLATWLLESRYPSEFNKRKGAGEPGDPGSEDLIAAGISFVKQHGDSSPLVGATSGKAFIIRKNGDNQTSLKRLADFMK